MCFPFLLFLSICLVYFVIWELCVLFFFIFSVNYYSWVCLMYRLVFLDQYYICIIKFNQYSWNLITIRGVKKQKHWNVKCFNFSSVFSLFNFRYECLCMWVFSILVIECKSKQRNVKDVAKIWFSPLSASAFWSSASFCVYWIFSFNLLTPIQR